VDKVFLKIQPYVQSSLARRSNQKLAFKFYGPFVVLQRIGSVAYKLDLPPHSSIHPMFHVSQLKKVVGSAISVSPVLPDELTTLQALEKIKQQRMVNQGNHFVVQVLVKWSSSPESMAMWEELESLIDIGGGLPPWNLGIAMARSPPFPFECSTFPYFPCPVTQTNMNINLFSSTSIIHLV
jgi:hypothetical protein